MRKGRAATVIPTVAAVVVAVVAGAALAVVAQQRDAFVADQPTTSPGASPAAAEAEPLDTVVDEIVAADVTASPATEVSVEVNPSINDPESMWVVVNKTRPIEPLTWTPPDLVSLSAIPGGSGHRLRAEAAAALGDLYAAARGAGVPFSVTSSYRSYSEQSSTYWGYASSRGTVIADLFSARPGYSEHQLGLSVDVYGSTACRLKACFGSEPTGTWLAQNAAEYGFVIRYPLDHRDVTGYLYEPWHLRYVGTELALAVRDSPVETLEEYFELPAAPGYS